ncbi:MAG: HD domain-containing protein [Vicinamibacterales bacterium]
MLPAFVTALAFASRRHVGQLRKDGRTPYVNHLIEVCDVLVRDGRVGQVDVLMAAALHDTVEDTATTFDEIAQAFGDDVAGLVREMTDDTTLPRTERRRRQVVHAPHLTDAAKLIKIADKISNIRDVVRAPAPDWSMDRRRDYLDWAERVVAGCRGVNAALDAAFDATLREGRTALGINER